MIEYISFFLTHYENPFKPVDEKPPFQRKTSPSLYAILTPSNTPLPGLTPLTTPNGSSIASRTFTQLCNKVPIGCAGMPYIHPKNCPFQWAIANLNYLIIGTSRPTIPNGIQIQSGIFHNTLDRQIDQQTDRQAVWALCVTSSQWQARAFYAAYKALTLVLAMAVDHRASSALM